MILANNGGIMSKSSKTLVSFTSAFNEQSSQGVDHYTTFYQLIKTRPFMNTWWELTLSNFAQNLIFTSHWGLTQIKDFAGAHPNHQGQTFHVFVSFRFPLNIVGSSFWNYNTSSPRTTYDQ